jgi:HAD superfamily hydrolase (TIGR01458 family)
MQKQRCICLDIGGTLLSDVMGPALPGAAEAVHSLRNAGFPIRFVTNTTSLPPATLANHLRETGLLHDDVELYTPFTAAEHALTQRNAAAGLLIATEDQKRELAWFEEREDGPSVLLATEAHDWTIAQLQPAFRALLHGATLYALEVNRYFKQDDALITDLGPVAAFLEYASNTKAEVLGKPSALLFETLAAEVGLPLAALVMVGDDAEFDASKSIDLGMQGVLIRTGKYRDGDETRVTPAPTVTLDAMAELPGWLGVTATPGNRG